MIYRTGLSFHGILFGPKTISTMTKWIITVARDAQNKMPGLMWAPSSFHEAFDSVGRFACLVSVTVLFPFPQVQLSQTFFEIAQSLRKPSGPSQRQFMHRGSTTQQAFHMYVHVTTQHRKAN